MTVTLKSLDRLEERVGELLAAHDAARLDFSEYRDDPVRFMREVLAFEPWSKQVEVCQAVVNGKRVVVRGHHGAGKDAVLAALLLWACYAREMLCIVVSATEKQVLGQVWADLSRMWTGAGCFAGEVYVGELRVAGEKRILAMTSSSTSNLTGWHNHRGTGVFVAISESQAEQVGNAAFDAAEGNTAGEGSRIVVVGNPVKPEGRFFEVSRKPTWAVIPISAFDHPNVIEGRVVISGGPAPGWPEEMAAEYGADSAFYVSRVLGEFPTEGSVDSLIRRAWLDASFDRHDAGVKLARLPIPTLALDVARSLDRDESVAALAQGSTVFRLEAWRLRDLVGTSERFLSIAERLRLDWYAVRSGSTVTQNPTTEDPDKLGTWLDGMGVPRLRLLVDTPGIGGGVVDVLKARGRAPTEYWGWSPARDEKRFANRRAEVFWALRSGLEAGTTVLARDAKLGEELTAIEWAQDGKGRILLEQKEDLRKRLGRSPDRADAVTIAHGAQVGVLAGPTVRFSSVYA